METIQDAADGQVPTHPLAGMLWQQTVVRTG